MNKNNNLELIIQNLIKKYEDKIKSVENLKTNGSKFDPITKSDIERLDVRIYERKTFIEDLKLLLKEI